MTAQDPTPAPVQGFCPVCGLVLVKVQEGFLVWYDERADRAYPPLAEQASLLRAALDALMQETMVP